MKGTIEKKLLIMIIEKNVDLVLIVWKKIQENRKNKIWRVQ